MISTRPSVLLWPPPQDLQLATRHNDVSTSIIIMPATTTTPPPSIIPYMREIRSLVIGIVGTQTASFYEVQVNWRKGQKVNVCIYCPQLFS